MNLQTLALRRLGSLVHSTPPASLVPCTPDLVEAVGSSHPSIRKSAAAVLLALVASAAAEEALHALATPRFIRVCAGALCERDATEGDEESLSARLCVLLQMLSRRGWARAVLSTPELRRALIPLSHAEAAPFVLANVRSILRALG